jgi:uncharacterized membrane protein YjgN (DUF898 family)
MSDETQAAAGGDGPIVLSQRGDLKSFAWLSLRNGLLNLITLTLYRFWGKTEVRRRLWATTYLNDEAFEYTGRGVELFVGFLLALVVIALPFLCIIFGTQFLGPAIAPLLILPLYIFILFILGVGRFTAFRYLATRSAWRGIRFHMRGQAREFGLAWLGYVLLSGITLGWFWPAADRRLAGRLWGGLSFGDKDFDFDIEAARRERVYGAYTLAWIMGAIAYVIFVIVIVGAMYPAIQAASRGEPPPPSNTLHIMIVTYATLGIFTPVFIFVLAPFHAAMLRSIVAGIGLQGVRLRARVKWHEYAFLNLTNVIFLAISFGLLMPFVEARSRQFIIRRLETEGGFDLDTIGQASGLPPRFGEGIADAFGIATI